MHEYDPPAVEFQRPTETELDALRQWMKDDDMERSKAKEKKGSVYIPANRDSEQLPDWFRNTADRMERNDEALYVLFLYGAYPKYGMVVPPLVPHVEPLFHLYLEYARGARIWSRIWSQTADRKCIELFPEGSVEEFLRTSAGQILVFISFFGEREGVPLLRRYRSGLMRKEQVELIRMAVDRMVVHLRRLLRRCLDDRGQRFCSGWTTKELQTSYHATCRIAFHLLTRLLLHREFRSERLEVLILKYTHEEGCNDDILKGILEADEKRGKLLGLLREGTIAMVRGKGPSSKFVWVKPVPGLEDVDLNYYLSKRGLRDGLPVHPDKILSEEQWVAMQSKLYPSR
ncbi:hypothetical protein BJ508DRAFT_381968 [Ascobolus immersus RN42]|uniref:Uncharacterized protein n=1 Tax=Ascobolus immersus RN42 TaxID=1160509 RepID=A0A3N4HHT4_ASCIM|nr:hypothetical protein BJ508DRAFT_381968 [Ascobolus immersus RN42]